MKQFVFVLLCAFVFTSLSMPVYNGVYKRDTACGNECDCWDEAQITFQDEYAVPMFLFNGTFNGDCQGQISYGESNYTYNTFYDSDIWYYFYQDEQNGYVNVTGGPFCSYGNYTISTSASYWSNQTQYWQRNLMIVNDDKPHCSYYMKNITKPAYQQPPTPTPIPSYQNNSNYNNNTDYSNNSQSDYPSPYVGQYGPVENISNPRVLNGQYNLSDQCPSQCACLENLNITFVYMPWIQYIGYNFQGILGEYQIFDNFTQNFNGTYNDLVNELSNQFVNVTNYTIIINYYDNYSTEYYNSGKRAQEITINQWWNNCSYSLVRVGDPYVSFAQELIYFQSNANNNNNTVLNSSSNSYQNNPDGITPFNFVGFYNRTTNCPEGCCCYNLVYINYVQYSNYLNTFLLNGTYSGSACPKQKSYQPVNFTYTGEPQSMFFNFTAQGYAPFLEAWIGNYGSNYTFSLNVTTSTYYVQVYNVNQPQCTYSLESIPYYGSPSNPIPANNNFTQNNFNNNNAPNNNGNNNNYPSIDGVFDYFDGNYRINTPCDYSAGCGCWSDVTMTNFDADSDNDEPYFIMNGTYRTGRNSNSAYKTEKLYYPDQGFYSSSVTLNSENNGTVITVNAGDSHYNPNTQYYYQDIQIQNVLQPDCTYNLINFTGLNQGYDTIQNSVQLQLGKLSAKLRD